MILGRQKFVLACPKCTEKSDKTVRWLVNNPHPFCAACGADLSASRDELLQNVRAAEQALADDLANLRAGRKRVD